MDDTNAAGDAYETPSYDEFGLFHENAEEFGIPYDGPPTVRRVEVEVEPGRKVSSLVWGTEPPELVFIHGGAQNAHTWDTVALELDRPLLAIDLPSHGHSDGSPVGTIAVEQHAADVAAVIRELAPDAKAVIGMSLGGLTSLALAALAPELVRRLVLVDVTPGVSARKASAINAFVNGPRTFDSFDDLLTRTIEYNPTRTVASLRRGILHNAVQRPDGTWEWRYARFRSNESIPPPDYQRLWDAVAGLQMPVLLVRGMAEGSVVDDADESELVRLAPQTNVVHVPGAGHSIQGDEPVDLARIIDEFASVLSGAAACGAAALQ